MADNIPFQNVNLILENVEIGDLIEMQRPLFRHWGIVSRKIWNEQMNRWDVWIVHLTFPGVQVPIVSSGLCTGQNWFADGVVREDRLTLIADTSPCRIWNFLDATRDPYSGQMTVSRARSRIGAHRYHVLFSNCEGFCAWARYGWWVSLQANRALQVRRYLLMALVITIVAIILRWLYRM